MDRAALAGVEYFRLNASPALLPLRQLLTKRGRCTAGQTMDEDEMETGLLGLELDCMDEIDVSIQNVPALAQESDGAMMVLQPSCCHNAFTEWSEYSKRRLDAQVQAMRLLQTGQNVPASLMSSAGGRREHLTRCPDLDTTPPMDRLHSRTEHALRFNPSEHLLPLYGWHFILFLHI